MATIFIRDTGLLTTSSSTAITGAGNIANNGIEFPLKIQNIKFGVSASFDNNPSPGGSTTSTPFSYPKLGFNSIPAPIINLSGHIRKDGNTSSASSVIYQIAEGAPTLTDESGTSFTTEVKMLGLLEHASRTKGYKELYYKSTSTDNIFWALAPSVETTNSTYKCFRLRIKSLDITETPDSQLITWSCTLEVTN